MDIPEKENRVLMCYRDMFTGRQVCTYNEQKHVHSEEYRGRGILES